MKKIMMMLLLGTFISATAMAAVSAGDKKVKNALTNSETQVNEAIQVGDNTAGVTLANFESGDDMDSKVEGMFLLADSDGNGILSEAEFVDYKAAQAKIMFSNIAGDDNMLSPEEAKAWRSEKQAKEHSKKHSGKRDKETDSDSATGQ